MALASIAGLPRALTEWKPDAVLTILSPSMRCEPFSGVQHLRLACHDIEAVRLGRLVGPTGRQVEAVRAFVRQRHERLLVQCAMGLSRSPAFAIVALIEAGADPLEACRRVHTASPNASPNRLVLRLADQAFGLGGGVIEAARSTFTFRRKLTGALGRALLWAEVPQLDAIQADRRIA